MKYYYLAPKYKGWAGTTNDAPIRVKTNQPFAEGQIYMAPTISFSILSHPKRRHGDLVAVDADGQVAGIIEITPSRPKNFTFAELITISKP